MRRAPALSFLLVTVFIDMLGLGLIVPIVPALMTGITGDAADGARWSGLTASSYGLLQFSLAVAGRSGRESLVGLARAWRTFAVSHPGQFAVSHPGQYAAAQRQLRPEHLRLIELSYAVLRGYGLEEPALSDALRFVRRTLHGFVMLETCDGFGHPRDLDASWHRIVGAVHTTLHDWRERA